MAASSSTPTASPARWSARRRGRRWCAERTLVGERRRCRERSLGEDLGEGKGETRKERRRNLVAITSREQQRVTIDPVRESIDLHCFELRVDDPVLGDV